MAWAGRTGEVATIEVANPKLLSMNDLRLHELLSDGTASEFAEANSKTVMIAVSVSFIVSHSLP